MPPNEPISTVALIASTLAIILGGGGGLAAWFRFLHDRKRGVKEDDRADHEQLNAQAIALLDTQFNVLITPLRDEVKGLKEELKGVKEEIKQINRVYRKSIHYIQALHNFLTRNHPEVDISQIPVPEEIASDI